MAYDEYAICKWCGSYMSCHGREHLARECYPKQIEAKDAEIERLRAYISDLDGKHIGTPTDGGEFFIDEGVIVASDVLGTQAG